MATIFNNPVNISETLQSRLFPTIIMWNRLEGRPRTHNFDKALKAEVRDALWMLCKQWQMGEFKGEDAGSPVFSKIKINSSSLSEYTLGNGSPLPLDNNLPIEVLVEQKQIILNRNKTKISIDIRLQLGKYWLKLLKSKSLESYYEKYLAKYSFSLPDKDRTTDYIYAHKEELQKWQIISGRCMDGFELILAILAGEKASNNIILDDSSLELTLNSLGDELIKFYINNFTQPDGVNNAWLPDRLEYKTSFTDDGAKNILKAEEYYQGHLDWYAFNLKTTQSNSNTSKDPFQDTFIPTPVEFDGMPDKRWWKFEDHKTSFGDVTPATTDLSKLLLIEFGLTFANDWFLLPFDLPVGSISEIDGLMVTNNFGDNYWINATEKGGSALTDWSMFRQTSEKTNKKLFLCPSAIKVQEANPLEEIWLIRDEMANMVWGIEKIVPSLIGIGVQGSEYALQNRQYHEKIIGPAAEIDNAAKVYYRAMTDVPENWIPLIPVHADGHSRQIQLQRGSMLRIIEGDNLTPEKIKPLTGILREGLEIKPKPLPYYIHEEEVTRSGTRIIQGFQRTRGMDGQVYVWFGAKKKTGRGEGNSGLAFDQLETVKNK